MTVRYMPDGLRPMYVCAQLHTQFAAQTCQFIRGDGIDAAVAQLLLAAIEPAQLTIALEAIEHLEAHARAIDHQWHLRIERARYEAERARRRYEEVEPLCGAQSYVAAKLENRLVTKFRRDER